MLTNPQRTKGANVALVDQGPSTRHSRRKVRGGQARNRLKPCRPSRAGRRITRQERQLYDIIRQAGFQTMHHGCRFQLNGNHHMMPDFPLQGGEPNGVRVCLELTLEETPELLLREQRRTLRAWQRHGVAIALVTREQLNRLADHTLTLRELIASAIAELIQLDGSRSRRRHRGLSSTFA